jgi:PKD repeat protein
VWILASRRNTLFLTVLLTALLSVVAFAQAASAASVTVVQPSGAKTEVDLSTLTPDVNETYGDSRVSGVSLRALLIAANADSVYRSVRIPTSGGTITQTKTQIEASQRPPAVYESGGQVWFVYGSGPRQQVVGEITQSQSSDDGPVAKAKASRSKAKVRQSISYTASVSNAADGEQFTYIWRFDDGTTKTGKNVKHSFKTRGAHRALLIARPVGASDSSTDATTAVVVQIGARVKSDKDRDGSGTNDSANAPTTGSADGRSGNGGDGTNAEQPAEPKKKRKPAEAQQPEELTQVEGQLLSPETTTPQPTVAARSGQQTQQADQGTGITTEQAAGASALLLLGYGALLELGVLKKFRPRMLRN